MNKLSILCLIALAISFSDQAVAQSYQPTNAMTRPRIVSAAKPKQTTVAVSNRRQGQEPRKTDSDAKPVSVTKAASNDDSKRLSPTRIRARIDEAKRSFKSRPQPTALSSGVLEYVTLAAVLPENSHIHLIRIPKETFLRKGSEVSATTSLGLPVDVSIARANGVNTAVTIFDHNNRALAPLLVEYPIERRGAFREMAYYTSAHPALMSPDMSKAGQLYVNSMVELAARRLRDKGFPVAQNLVDIAKRLCIVEHIDHDRFRNENRIALFEEIYSLYALNELETFRYSVSSAGAGGMVQMIPWTYALMRQRHPGVGLNPDFVLGMRNHGNALEAMLLYMQDTWSDLIPNEDVQTALAAKQISTPDT